MYIEYNFILKYFLVCLAFVVLLFAVSFLLVFQKPESEKLSSYECGFNPFGDARNKFEVRFYLVGVLFLIFDLELSFLFPFVVSLQYISVFGIYAMMFFLLLLGIGF